jgi:signal transduction histidine kinase
MNDQIDRRSGWIDNLSRHLTQQDELTEGHTMVPSIIPILQHMTARIRSDASLTDLLSDLAASTCEAVDTEVALVRIFDPEQKNLAVQGLFGVPPHLVGTVLGERTVAAELFHELRPGTLITFTPDRPLVLQHASDLVSAEFQEMQRLGAQHILVLPLFHHGKLLGRLDLLRTRDEPFSVQDGTMASILGTLIAGAIYGLTQDDSGERYNRIIEASFAFQRSIEPLANVGEMFQNVVEALRHIVACDRCYGLLWNDSRREFSPVAVSGAERGTVDRLKQLSFVPTSIPALEKILRDDEPLIIRNSARTDLLPASVASALNLNSIVIVPLRARQRELIGAVILDRSGAESEFSNRDIAVVTTIAPHSALMIENALLYEEVKRGSDRLALVNDIGIELATLTNLTSLFRQVHLHVASVLTANRFCLGLLLPDGHSIEYHYVMDDRISEQPVNLELDTGPLGRCIREKRSILMNSREPNDKQDWFPPAQKKISPSESMLAAPIIVGQRAIGVISAQSDGRGSYTRHDLDLLGTIGMQTGVAIENARVYSMAQARGERRAYLLDQMITRQEAERKTIADDIHNDTLQTLASCLYSIDLISRRATQLTPEQTQEELCGVRDNLAENIDRLRHIIFQIRPSTLDILGLEPALREHAKYVQQDTGIEISLAVSLPERPSNDMETAIYRIVQETIHLVRGRVGVQHIVVRIRQKGQAIIVTIADDGRADHQDVERDQPSNDAEVSESEFSIIALRERVELAGGQVKTASLPTGGTTLQIILPNRSTP